MFTGSMVAVVTPFKNGKVDYAALKKLLERQIANGTSVIIPCGTTGESATLTHEEHDAVIAATVQSVGKRALVLAGAGSNATHEAVRLNVEAERAGADGTLHITPYYNKPTQEGLYQHFKAVAESCSIPVIVYNVPSRTGVNLLPETVARLAEIKNIVGIKEAAGSLEQVQKLVQFCGPEFTVLSGEDAQTLDMYKLGAKGAISVTANVVPQDTAREWALFKAGRVAEAQKLHDRLMILHEALFFETNPIPVKTALAMMGLIEEEFRLPMVKISDANRARLKKALEAYGV